MCNLIQIEFGFCSRKWKIPRWEKSNNNEGVSMNDGCPENIECDNGEEGKIEFEWWMNLPVLGCEQQERRRKLYEVLFTGKLRKEQIWILNWRIYDKLSRLCKKKKIIICLKVNTVKLKKYLREKIPSFA